MIHSRPQTGTFASFLLFLLASLFLLGIQTMIILRDPAPAWYNYVIMGVLVPILLFVGYRVLFQYKKVRMGDRKIEVVYPQFRLTRSYPLSEVLYWKESIVKTGKTSTYKEIELKFRDQRMIRLGYKEYTDYDKMLKYLAQKLPTVRVK